MQRKFILGDEWLYFKIYSGPKTLETILINEIYRLIERLFQRQIIDKFFFIRYTDPDYHLRIRFHMPDNSKIYLVIQLLNKSLKYYINKNLIWKVCVDTYNRELERYGSTTMHEMEALFSLDSMAIISFLKDTEETGNNYTRWLWGIKCMDLFLEKFGLALTDKVKFYEMLSSNYFQEFNMNKPLKLQLDKKYRNEMAQIGKVIGIKEDNSFSGIKHIKSYMQNAKFVIQRVLEISKGGKLEIPLNNLLISSVHMHFNRLFRTKQRMHELVIYYFMHKFYKSQIAKLKYKPEITFNK